MAARRRGVRSTLFSKCLVATAVVGSAGVCAVVLRKYLAGVNITNTEQMNGKTVVITGANRGIGKATALDCARRGARVIMACRDLTLCEEARRFIVMQTSNAQVHCRHCDLASQKSIRAFAAAFNATEPRLDVLVNNAGVMRTGRLTTAEGIELQLGVNHMGHFLLTSLLLDKLKTSQPSRILNLVSLAHRMGTIDFRDLNGDRHYCREKAYYQSQLAFMLFTQEMSRKLADTKVTCNAVYPGLCKTDLIRFMPIYSSTLASIVVAPMRAVILRTPAEGATVVVWAASDPKLVDLSGEYISGNDEAAISTAGMDKELAARFWATSCKWTELS